MYVFQYLLLSRLSYYLKKISLFSFFFTLILLSNDTFGAQLKITFDPSPDPRVVGHKLYFAKASEHLTIYMVDLKDSTVYLTPNLPKNSIYYFGATAYDQYGNESEFSNIYTYQDTEQTIYPVDDIGGNSTDIFYVEYFNNYMAGDNAMYWYDTGQSNSMFEDNSLFEIYTINNNNVFGTNSSLDDIHSHYIGPCNYDLASFEFSGRMMRTDHNGGVGVTFLSNYPVTDKYYRLGAEGQEPFHIAVHSQANATVYGIIATGVVAQPDEWYLFRINVRETVLQTEIQAKVWNEYDPEPDYWQIDAFDDTPHRHLSGTFGLWGHANGSKYWDDLMVQYLQN